jgi:hypothetical protein
MELPESALVLRHFVATPKLCAHPRAGNRLHNVALRNAAGRGGYCHATVQHIEGKMLFASDNWTDLTLEDRHFLSAVHPGDFEMAVGGRLSCWRDAHVSSDALQQGDEGRPRSRPRHLNCTIRYRRGLAL